MTYFENVAFTKDSLNAIPDRIKRSDPYAWLLCGFTLDAG